MSISIILQKLESGEIFGKDGALALSRCQILHNATTRKDISAMMLLANIHYTAMGASILHYGGITGRIFATYHLWKAKKFADQAFLTFGYHQLSVVDTVTYLDVTKSQKKKEPLELDVGDVHILMSCYEKWVSQILMRLNMSHNREMAVLDSCAKTLRRHGDVNMWMLTNVTLLSVMTDCQKKEQLRADLTLFWEKGFTYYTESDFPEKEDRTIVMTVCRVGRILGFFNEVVQLAEKYRLYDQKNKAFAGI